MKAGDKFRVKAHFGEYEAICTESKMRNGLEEVKYDVPELNCRDCIIWIEPEKE